MDRVVALRRIDAIEQMLRDLRNDVLADGESDTESAAHRPNSRIWKA
jgi:hypothetical protein